MPFFSILGALDSVDLVICFAKFKNPNSEPLNVIGFALLHRIPKIDFT